MPPAKKHLCQHLRLPKKEHHHSWTHRHQYPRKLLSTVSCFVGLAGWVGRCEAFEAVSFEFFWYWTILVSRTVDAKLLGVGTLCSVPTLAPSLPPSLPISNCAEIPFIKAVPFVGPDHQLDHGILQGCGFGILIVRICLVSLHISQRIFLPLSPSIYIAIRSQESELCHWSWEIIGPWDVRGPLRPTENLPAAVGHLASCSPQIINNTNW